MSRSPSHRSGPGPKEKRFHDALRDLFVGAKVDGESGYINLMRMKAAYYEHRVGPQLLEDVARALKDFPEFREELFDKLHAFFSRYFSKSGSICFAYTPGRMSVYEKMYTDERDVVLFWKTHMLSYVKTDRLFRDLKVELDGQTFFFDCTGLEHKKNNEKRQLVFDFQKVESDGTLRMGVVYSERGRITKTEDILKALKKAGHPLREALLEKAMVVFERQSEVDYFINKDARGFLREQFDLWMYQYLFKDSTDWTPSRIKQLQGIKEIALKLIDFIAQFEDELARIWNKPKFVRGSHYVITLDRMAGQEGGLDLLADFLSHAGMKAQVAEWVELGIVDGRFNPQQILNKESRKKGKESDVLPALLPSLLNPAFHSLPLDTKHFPDLQVRLLGLFDNLDETLDGRLIKSENYQALNTLREKYKERIKLFYIDPPYNTGEDEFAYLDSFQRSSWLSMVSDRLELGRSALQPDGAILCSIGREEFASLKIAMNQVFGEENCLAELVWEKGRKNDAKYFSVGHDYIAVYAKSLAELKRRKIIWREEKPGAREILVEFRRLSAIPGNSTAKVQEGLRKFYGGLPKGHPSLKYRRYSRVDTNGVWRDIDILGSRTAEGRARRGEIEGRYKQGELDFAEAARLMEDQGLTGRSIYRDEVVIDGMDSLARHFYLPIVYSVGKKVDYLTHIIDVPSEREFLEDFKKAVSKSGCTIHELDWWMFSKLDQYLDSPCIPYYDPRQNKVRSFIPDFIFWGAKGTHYTILFVDPKGMQNEDWRNKVAGYKRLFEEANAPKKFAHGDWTLSIRLCLYNRRRDRGAEGDDSRLWHDNPDALFKDAFGW